MNKISSRIFLNHGPLCTLQLVEGVMVNCYVKHDIVIAVTNNRRYCFKNLNDLLRILNFDDTFVSVCL